MSDKSDAIIGAAHAVFPQAEIRICYFHVMQAVHRWLRKSDNGVTDRACARGCASLPLLVGQLTRCARSGKGGLRASAATRKMIEDVIRGMVTASTEHRFKELEHVYVADLTHSEAMETGAHGGSGRAAFARAAGWSRTAWCTPRKSGTTTCSSGAGASTSGRMHGGAFSCASRRARTTSLKATSAYARRLASPSRALSRPAPLWSAPPRPAPCHPAPPHAAPPRPAPRRAIPPRATPPRAAPRRPAPPPRPAPPRLRVPPHHATPCHATPRHATLPARACYMRSCGTVAARTRRSLGAPGLQAYAHGRQAQQAPGQAPHDRDRRVRARPARRTIRP
jgi:hypothetical protein